MRHSLLLAGLLALGLSAPAWADETVVVTDSDGNTAAVDSQGNVYMEDADGNTAVVDSEGNMVVEDTDGNVHVQDAEGNSVTIVNE